MALMRVSIRRKTVSGRTIIEGLEFEVAQGEVVALVGPSGCGKTTTLRIVAGLDTAFDGQVGWTDGRKRRLGTVFQEPRLLPWRTVRQNLALVRPDPAHANALLEELGLTQAADQYPAALSLGMARRAALARAFAVEPDLLLLDEPFVSLDPAAAATARQLLVTTWAARPCAALLVTHDREEAAGLADRILVLSAPGCRVTQMIEIPPAARRGAYFSVAR